jgi:hypothetical protein
LAVSSLSIAKSLNKQTSENDTTASSVASIKRQIDPSAFQAVFLDSGQVYFGKMSQPNSAYYKLTNVYYLKDNETNLIKLGSEPHQPKDTLYIPVTSVTFWENLQHANQFGGKLQ